MGSGNFKFVRLALKVSIPGARICTGRSNNWKRGSKAFSNKLVKYQKVIPLATLLDNRGGGNNIGAHDESAMDVRLLKKRRRKNKEGDYGCDVGDVKKSE